MSYENKAYRLGKEDRDLNDRNSQQHVSPAPVIVTSPAPDANKTTDLTNKLQGGKHSDTASSGSGGSRRGSASIGGEVCMLCNVQKIYLQSEVNANYTCTDEEIMSG